MNNLTEHQFTANNKPHAIQAPACLLECYLEKMPKSHPSPSKTQTQTRQDRESPDTYLIRITPKPSRSTKTITEGRENPDRSLFVLRLT
jgi:hypothetical protein